MHSNKNSPAITLKPSINNNNLGESISPFLMQRGYSTKNNKEITSNFQEQISSKFESEGNKNKVKNLFRHKNINSQNENFISINQSKRKPSNDYIDKKPLQQRLTPNRIPGKGFKVKSIGSLEIIDPFNQNKSPSYLEKIKKKHNRFNKVDTSLIPSLNIPRDEKLTSKRLDEKSKRVFTAKKRKSLSPAFIERNSSRCKTPMTVSHN